MYARFCCLFASLAVVLAAAGCGGVGPEPEALEQAERGDQVFVAAGMTFTALKDISLEEDNQLTLYYYWLGDCTIDASGLSAPQILEGDAFSAVEVKEERVRHYEWPEHATMPSDFTTSTTTITLVRESELESETDGNLVVSCNGIIPQNADGYLDFEHVFLDKEQIQAILVDYFVID